MLNFLSAKSRASPIEHISPILMEANYPEKVLISIGATKYTPFGESRYLQVGDEVCIVAFDMTKFSNEDIKRMLESGARDIESASVIRRVVVRESSLR